MQTVALSMVDAPTATVPVNMAFKLLSSTIMSVSPILYQVSWRVLESIRVSLLASKGVTNVVSVHALDPYL